MAGWRPFVPTGVSFVIPVGLSFDDLVRAVLLTADTSLNARNMGHVSRVSLLIDLKEAPFGWPASTASEAPHMMQKSCSEGLPRWNRRYIGNTFADVGDRHSDAPGEAAVLIDPRRRRGGSYRPRVARRSVWRSLDASMASRR